MATPRATSDFANPVQIFDQNGNAVDFVTPGKAVYLVLTLDTLIYANGDVLCDTIEIQNAARIAGGLTRLRSIVVHDEDDQGTAIFFTLFKANRSLGAKNAAPTIVDADARDIVATHLVAAADFADLGANRHAQKDMDKLIECAAGQTSLWLSASVASGTPTYTANGVRVDLVFEYVS